MNFIELTSESDDEIMMINFDKVMDFISMGDGTLITYSDKDNGTPFIVLESYAKVKTLVITKQ